MRDHAQVWRRFPLQKDGGRFVINGFCTCIREQFTKLGTAIYYQQVEWRADQLKLEDFHGKGLGGTDPTSLRYVVFKGWKGLVFAAELNVEHNGAHASARPVEALAERANWFGMPWESDSFGRALLATGLPLTTIKAECDDPVVPDQIRLSFLFDLVGGLGQPGLSEEECLHQCTLQSATSGSVVSPRRACLPEVSEIGVVCMMRACGSGGRVCAHHRFVPQVSCHCLGS